MEKLRKSKNFHITQHSALGIFDKALKEIANGTIGHSLVLLKDCEKVLEKVVQCGMDVDSDLILATLHNIAFCSQRTGKDQECAAYLEACVYNVKNSIGKINYLKPKSRLIRKIRHLCLLYLQLSHCLARLKDHEAAYKNAKKALKSSVLTIRLCMNFCMDFIGKPGKTQVEKKIYTRAYNVLHYLFVLISGKKVLKDPKELCMRTALGVQKQPKWINDLNFAVIFEIKLLTLTELKSLHSISAEISKDFMLDKICMGISACYLISKELENLNVQGKKAGFYRKIALAISEVFLPEHCNLLAELREKQLKRAKGSVRSKSAKNTKNIQIRTEKPSLNTKLFNVQAMPWVPRSVRNCGSKPLIADFQKKIQVQKEKKPDELLRPNEKSEPEPPLSEKSSSSSSEVPLQNFMIPSSDLYGDYYEEEPDKYEYMPLKLNDC